MDGPVIEYSICIFDDSRTKLLQRLALPCPAPIYPVGHELMIDDDTYSVNKVSTSITTNDNRTFTTYVTEVLVKKVRY